MMRWQWHQLDHIQITCTSFQTDNHNSTSSFIFFWPDALPAMSNQRCRSTEALGIIGAGFYRSDGLPVKYGPQPRKTAHWTHRVSDHQPTPKERDAAPYMPDPSTLMMMLALNSIQYTQYSHVYEDSRYHCQSKMQRNNAYSL